MEQKKEKELLAIRPIEKRIKVLEEQLRKLKNDSCFETIADEETNSFKEWCDLACDINNSPEVIAAAHARVKVAKSRLQTFLKRGIGYYLDKEDSLEDDIEQLRRSVLAIQYNRLYLTNKMYSCPDDVAHHAVRVQKALDEYTKQIDNHDT